MLEKDFEDILEIHPYLLDPSFKKYKTLRQKKIHKGRVDLFLISDDNLNIVIIEIKKDKLTVSSLSQIKRYYYYFRRKHKGTNVIISAYLVGTSSNLDISRLKWLKIKLIDKDIPRKIKLCPKCNTAFDYKVFTCKCGFRM